MVLFAQNRLMMSKYKLVLKYINHTFHSHNSKGFGIHSPFIFHLVTQIIHDYTPFYCYEDIEKQRMKLLANPNKISVTDYGSGSKTLPDSLKMISEISKNSLKPKKHAQLLFRMINHLSCKHILELGTSLGVTASYLASVSGKSKVITLEGCPEISKMARETFNNLNLKNIELITGNFDDTLIGAIEKLNTLDFVFFDGNHRKDPTLSYFNSCLQHIHNDTVFVFDDIHSKEEMEEVWTEIKSNTQVTVTLDLFYMGIVFFRKEFTPQHFKIKF